MRIKILISLLLFFLIQPVSLLARTNNVDYLQSITCFIDSYGASGGGVFIVKTNRDIFILSAFHVVENSKENSIFKDVKVQILTYQDDIKVGLIESDAQIVRFDKEDDLVLLKLKQKNFTTNSVKFFNGECKNIRVGEFVCHAGNFWGMFGANSYTEGILSHKGRIIDKKLYWQTDCQVISGSSGAGIFNSNGELIGILTMKRESSGYFIPIFRIKEWAKEQKCEFIFTDSCDYSM